MDTLAKDSGIVQRTQDLCQALVEQGDFAGVKGKLDAFMSDELLKFQYSQINELGSHLQMKQSYGIDPKPEEVTQFESLRDEFLKNPVAQGFLDAQKELQQVQQLVGRYLDKTFELGRRPEYEDVHDGSCGGCGCH